MSHRKGQSENMRGWLYECQPAEAVDNGCTLLYGSSVLAEELAGSYLTKHNDLTQKKQNKKWPYSKETEQKINLT